MQRELALVEELRAKYQYLRPVLIPVVLPGLVSTVFRLRDFDKGDDAQKTFSVASSRCFVPGSRMDSFRTLRDQLKPRVRFFGSQTARGVKTEHPSRLSDDAFDCYRTLFPVEKERDKPDAILEWLTVAYDHSTREERARMSGKRFKPSSDEEEFAAQWGELFATYEVGGSVVGMAYHSIDRISGWVFGNYFGVLSPWRDGKRPQRFHRSIESKLRHIAPRFKGYVFEVETIEMNDLVSAAQKASGVQDKTALPPLTDEEEAAIRAYRRLKVFGRRGAKALLKAGGGFVYYRQPAMDEPIGRQNEVELILLVLKTGGKAGQENTIDAMEVFEFLYDELFHDGYEELPTTKFEAYAAYLRAVKREMVERLQSENGRTLVALGDPVQTVAKAFRERASGTGLRLSSLDRYNDRVPL
jgi:hypothetical protein